MRVALCLFAALCVEAHAGSLRQYVWTNDLARPTRPAPLIEIGQADDVTLHLEIRNGGQALDLTGSVPVLFVWDTSTLLKHIIVTGTVNGSVMSIRAGYPEVNIPFTNSYAAEIKLYTAVGTNVFITEVMKPRWKTTYSADADATARAGVATTSIIVNVSVFAADPDTLPISGLAESAGAVKEVVTNIGGRAAITCAWAEEIGQLAQVEILSVSATNFTYQIRSGSGIVTNAWKIFWTAK